MPNETCPVRVQDIGTGWKELCGRPVKRNGMCGIHARSADLQTARKHEVQDKYQELHRLQKQLALLNVKCRVDGYRLVLTDAEGLVKRLRTIQIMAAAADD